MTTKGVGVLFEAAHHLASQNRLFDLLVIGDGPERASLERLSLAGPLAGRVRFAGRLMPAQLDAALAKAALLVVPSLGGEVFGLVIAENMLRGLPVVASDLGAFVEVIGDGGVTFRTGDSQELAREISRILDDPTFAARLAERARKRAVEFCDLTRMVEAHARVYREAHP